MQKSDEETIVRRALELFRRQGYHHTSMSDVGEASGLLKGSLYHYFQGKEQLAVHAIERVREDFRTQVLVLADSDAETPLQRLQRVNTATFAYFTAQEGGCLLGNLALETAGTVTRFRGPIAEYFQEWMRMYERIYRAADLGADRARIWAEEAVALIQGALMVSRVFGDTAPLHRALQGMTGRLQAALSA